MKDLTYQFKVQDAIDYKSSDIATLLSNFRFWLYKNLANEKNIRDGRVWTFNSIKAYQALFPWLSKGKIERILNKLTESGKLIKSNFNEKGYDRTTWYSLNEPDFVVKTDETELQPTDSLISQKQEMHFLFLGNAFPENRKPIPDSKQDKKQDNLIYIGKTGSQASPAKKQKSSTKRELSQTDSLSNIDVYPSELNRDAWLSFLEYRRGQHRFRYKTASSELVAIRQIMRLSNGNHETQARWIENCIAGGWKGINADKQLQSDNVSRETLRKQTTINQPDNQQKKVSTSDLFQDE